MNTYRRRVAGGLLLGLARAAAVGSIAGVVGVAVTSCAPAGQAGRAERDSTGLDTLGELAMAEPEERATRASTGREVAAAPTLRGECTTCHPAAHDAVLGTGREASLRCGECHTRVHDEIQAMYAGRTAHPVVRADPMFAARVECGGCHADSVLAVAPGPARLAAIDRTCVGCHGRTFAGMLPRWSAGVAWRTRAVSMYVASAAADPGVSSSAAARARVRTAERAVAFITTADGLHNVRGTDALLRAALDSARAAYAGVRVTPPAAPALGPDPARVSCVGCHYGIEGAREAVSGEPFDHGSHVLRGGLACARCHSDADYLLPGGHDVNPRHGRTTIDESSCDGCHHAPAQKMACGTCHAGDARLARALRVTMPLRLRPADAPPARNATFQHIDHADVECTKCHTSSARVTDVATCATCHEAHHREAADCTACHGTDIRTAHTAADHLTCARCHARETVALLTPDRSFCLSCHADRADHKGGRECATCHMQSTPSELRRRISGGAR